MSRLESLLRLSEMRGKAGTLSDKDILSQKHKRLKKKLMKKAMEARAEYDPAKKKRLKKKLMKKAMASGTHY